MNAPIDTNTGSLCRRNTLVVGTTLAIIAFAVVCLCLLGRRWFCECGEIYLWVGDPDTQHNSQHLSDPYTFSHLQHGLLLYAALWYFTRRSMCGIGFLAAMLVESMWEVIENTSWIIERYRESTISLGYYGDSILNSVSDILICAVGYFFAATHCSTASVSAYIGIETLMLVLIRDSLILNVVMLIYPIEAIKEWQMQ